MKGFQKLGIFKTADSPGSGSWNSEEAILASGDSAAFFPHGVGHSLGMDVHDVPSASKPEVNHTIGGVTLGHESFYRFLRLRLPLQAGMVVVSLNSLRSILNDCCSRDDFEFIDRRARHLLLAPPALRRPRLETH